MHDDRTADSRPSPTDFPTDFPSAPPDDDHRSAQPEPSACQLATSEELLEFRRQFQSMAVVADIVEADAPEDNAPPRNIGRFEIVQEIGSGSYGTVYVALDSAMSRNVAIKIAHVGTHASDRLKKRFLKEAHAAARMGHPNVVTVHEYGEQDGLLYIVYQMCIGQTLAEWLTEQPDRIDVDVAAEIVRQLAMGLEHAHRHGIVHRDVKPSNVILERCRRVGSLTTEEQLGFIPRLTDFGLAHDRLASELSINDSLLGTIDYMSPEQVQGSVAGKAPTSDIYSLGVVFYRLLSGVMPARGTNVLEILHQICAVRPPSPRYINPNVPPDLAAICEKCIAKQPEQRYASCDALVKDIENWQNSRPVTARPTPTHERAYQTVMRAPVVSSLVAAIVIVSLLSAVLVFSMSQQVQRKNVELSRMLAEALRSKLEAMASMRMAEQANLESTISARESMAARMRADANNYSSDIRYAYMDLEKGQILGASNTVERMKQLFSDSFLPRFDYLVLESMLENATVQLSSHTPGATALAAIPGTELVVSAGTDHQLLFHNSVTGDLESIFNLDDDCEVTSLAVDWQAKRIAIGSRVPHGKPWTNILTVYELNPNSSNDWLGNPTHIWPIVDATCQSLRFSKDGRYLVYGGRYKPPMIVDLKSYDAVPINCISRHRKLEFSPDDKMLLAVSKEKALQIHDVASGSVVETIPCAESPDLAVWTPDGKYIIYHLYNDTGLDVIEASRPFRHVGHLNQRRGAICDIAITEAGDELVAATFAGAIVCWPLDNVATGFPIEPNLDIVPHAGVIEQLCITSTNHIVSVDNQGDVLSTPLPIIPKQQAVARPSAMVPFVAEKNLFLAGYPDGSVLVVDAMGSARRKLHPANGVAVTRVSGSAAGVAVGWQNGRVAFQLSDSDGLWVECGYVLATDGDARDILDLELSKDGERIVACGGDNHVRVWNCYDSREPLWEHQFTSDARSVRFVEDQVVCGGMFEEIGVFNTFNGKLEQSLKATSSTTALLYDPSRKMLVSAHEDGRLHFHQKKSSWKLLGSGLHSIEEIRSLTMSPDQSCFLAGTAHGKLDVWDANDRRVVGTLVKYPDKRPIDLVDVTAPNRLLMFSFAGSDAGFLVGANNPFEITSIQRNR